MLNISQTEQIIIEKILLFAKEKMKNLPQSHGWDHVQRVISHCKKISLTEKIDFFVVQAAAMLHDIGREIENNSEGKLCHAEVGSKIAYDFLIKQNLNKARAAEISHCIMTHRFRNNNAPESLEAKILYDADKLDSIGAIGIGRAFLFSGEISAKLHNPNVNIDSTQPYSDEDTAYREYIIKLQHIKDKMLTSEGRKLALSRHKFMEYFFKQMRNEINGIE